MSAPTPRRSNSAPIDSYPVRVMLGLVISLSFLLALVHLPVESSSLRVGWSAQPFTEQIVLDEVRSVRSKGANEAASEDEETTSPPPTTNLWTLQSEAASTAAPATQSPNSTNTGPDSDQDTGREQYEEVQSVTELGLSNRTPHLAGGAGSLYLHIKYPPKALEEGIEGRLTLEFTVQRKGSVRDIEVVDSLHPLCDSAAVEGVRQVEFVPATRNGDPIPMRLALPVRFQLTADTSPAPLKEHSP